MSLTPQQRAQVLSLYHGDAVSLVIIALMTELSVSAVRRVVHEPPQGPASLHPLRQPPRVQNGRPVNAATRAATSKGVAS